MVARETLALSDYDFLGRRNSAFFLLAILSIANTEPGACTLLPGAKIESSFGQVDNPEIERQFLCVFRWSRQRHRLYRFSVDDRFVEGLGRGAGMRGGEFRQQVRHAIRQEGRRPVCYLEVQVGFG